MFSFLFGEKTEFSSAIARRIARAREVVGGGGKDGT